ncbi:MAG: ThuA domain-containing protein [Bacteroidetes bacterium]|nr:ThuA domain-containing protein [Bacteroidota bacterium]
MKQRLIYYILITSTIIGLAACKDNSTDPNNLPLLTFDTVKVALYIDDAVWPNCQSNTKNKLKEIGLPYTVINKDTILSGGLLSYSVLLMPGGKPDLYEQNLGQLCATIIRDYISRGGGYIGICGGAFLAARTNVWRGWAGEPRVNYSYSGFLRIFNGIADGPIEDFAPTYINSNCIIKIDSSEHPILKNLPASFSCVYDHGPMFVTDNDPNAVILGVSGQSKPMLVTTLYGNGRIFLSSGHPEAMNSASCTSLIINAILWCSKQNF